MSRISMDTDNVRAISSRIRGAADSLDISLSSIKQTVTSAEWQSQAREDFIVQLMLASKGASQSTNTLRSMANALEEEANQWEVVGSKFNGPFPQSGGSWGSATYSASGAAVLGASTGLISRPVIRRPSWWPFPVGENEKIVTDKLENLEMQREYTVKALEEKRAEYKKYSTRVSELNEDMRATDLWKPLKNLAKSLGYDVKEKEPKFENLCLFIASFASPKTRLLALKPFVENLMLSVFQTGKLFYQLELMKNAYQKSQAISTEISSLTNQLTSIDNQIATFGGN